MEKEQYRAAKGRMIALMQAGHSWQEAASLADIPISRSAAYRLLHKVRTQGEIGLQDGRHGHPVKLREPVLDFLKDSCQTAPDTPSHVLQRSVEEHFGIRVSVSHLNATRAALGLRSRTAQLREKNRSRRREVKHIGKKEQADCSW
jgi:transposase